MMSEIFLKNALFQREGEEIFEMCHSYGATLNHHSDINFFIDLFLSQVYVLVGKKKL